MQLSKKKKIVLIAFLGILFLLGIGMMIYPYASAVYAESVRSKIQTEYQDVVDDPAKTEEINAIREAAIEYNHKLYSGIFSPLKPSENGYYDQLKVKGSDIMCYIRIPAIEVSLPVYHGIGENSLQSGAGHMPQTSLPIGGKNTHAVISAHTGMAASPMFTDLGLLEIGDLVYIDVLGETLTYKVIETPPPVLPYEVDAIKIQSDKDLLTLVTCTPINVNSHRLLVHCERVENTEEIVEENEVRPKSETRNSIYDEAYLKNLSIGLFFALIILLIAMAFVLVQRSRSRKKKELGENESKK